MSFGDFIGEVGFSSGCLLSGEILYLQGVWWDAFFPSTRFQLVVPL
jgi:hypothetical protein